MVFSSRRSTRSRGGTLAGEGVPSITGASMVLGDRGGDGGGPSSALGTLEPLEEVLGRPVLDPWYRSGERFPSIPTNPQPPPVD
jgi:hypothetical protein